MPQPPAVRRQAAADAASGEVLIAVVRHGERLDEVDKAAWRRIRTDHTRHDPPLNENGWRQAHAAGRVLAAKWPQDRVRAAVAVYSSPTVRTLATAAAVAKELEVPQVIPAYALNCCAAAKHFGVQVAFPRGQPAAEVTRGVPLSTWPPLGDVNAIDRRANLPSSFVDVVKDVAAAHSGGDRVVLVTHREGIWELQASLRAPITHQYCTTVFARYVRATGELLLWDGQLDKAYAAPAVTPSLGGPAGFGLGSLRVASHLWLTPGVPDSWVTAEPVPAGEELELLSEPQACDGDWGEFVLVRRAGGEQGWAEARHLQRHAGPEDMLP